MSRKGDQKIIVALKLLMMIILIIGLIFLFSVHYSDLTPQYKYIGYFTGILLIIPSIIILIAKYS